MSDQLIDAEELVRRYTPTELAETAEAYMAAVTDWGYHLAKPLGSPVEAPVILAHFAAMLAALQLQPGHRVLDFGAGSCWTSRMIAQTGCHVIACDVSETGLAMGRKLFELQPPIGSGTAEFLLFDGYHLDLPDASVDRISVMDAFHHVPNWREVLTEFLRVLRPGGRVVMAEGGPHHSRTPQAQEEMRNFTVVERDMVVEDFAALAAEVGFVDTLVAIYAGIPHLVPAAQFTEELQNGATARHAAIAFLDNHRLIALDKGGEAELTSRSPVGLAAAIRLESVDGRRLTVVVENVGTATWLGASARIGVVNLGVQLFDAAGRRLDLDFMRVALRPDGSATVAPGESVRLSFEVPVPDVRPFRLTLDLVSEGVAWFANIGASSPVQTDVLG